MGFLLSLCIAVFLGSDNICLGQTQLPFQSVSYNYRVDYQQLECPSSHVHVRLPPSLTTEKDDSWEGPPSGWLYGNWKITWSSNPLYQPFWNPEFDNSPYFPQNGTVINNDLATWNAQCEDDTKVYSVFLLDTEAEPGSFVFDTQATGALDQNNTWELLAWGYDTAGVGYIFLYENAPNTGGLANICIETRAWNHPTLETRHALFNALQEFQVPELSKMTEDVVQLRHDERRADMQPFACDLDCMNNTNYTESIEILMKELEDCPR